MADERGEKPVRFVPVREEAPLQCVLNGESAPHLQERLFYRASLWRREGTKDWLVVVRPDSYSTDAQLQENTWRVVGALRDWLKEQDGGRGARLAYFERLKDTQRKDERYVSVNISTVRNGPETRERPVERRGPYSDSQVENWFGVDLKERAHVPSLERAGLQRGWDVLGAEATRNREWRR